MSLLFTFVQEAGDNPDMLSEDKVCRPNLTSCAHPYRFPLWITALFILQVRTESVDLSTDATLMVDISDALSERDRVKFTVHTKVWMPRASPHRPNAYNSSFPVLHRLASLSSTDDSPRFQRERLFGRQGTRGVCVAP